MKSFLFYFAVTGWALGLIVHLLSIADIDITAKVPFVWILHLGIFVVWFPTIIKLGKNEILSEYLQSNYLNTMNPIGFYKIIFKNTPIGLIVIGLGGLMYAAINFMLFMTTHEGTPDIQDGQFILQNRGQLIRILTDSEYQHYKANEVRGFSGHWLAFYGLAAAILYPFTNKQDDK